MDAVDHHCEQIVELKGNAANAVPKGHVRNAFYLLRDFFEEEVAVFPRDLGQWIAVSIDLPANDALCIFVVSVAVIVIFRLHTPHLYLSIIDQESVRINMRYCMPHLYSIK